MRDRPPDDWNTELQPAMPPPPRKPRTRAAAASGGPPEPTPAERETRAAWVAAVRHFHRTLSGYESRYDSSPKWDGGACRTAGVTYNKPVWPKVVAEAEKAGVDGPALVAALFSVWAGERPPVPYDLYSPANLARAARRKAEAKARAAAQLQTEEAIYLSDTWGARQVIPDPREAERHVLDDTGRGLTPLFRYAAATLKGFTDVSARWAAAARAQILQSPAAYLETWAAVLPDDLKQLAAGAAVRT